MCLRLLLFVCVFCCAGLRAHPHMWIDVLVSPLLNEDGEIAALRQRWLFDPFFSGVFLQDLARLPEAERAAYWAQLEKDMFATLHEAHFYTHPQALFAAARAPRIAAEGDVIVLEVELPLLEPARSLAYQLYEPSFYAEMLHAREQPREAQGCTLALQEAAPDDGLRAQAAALDVSESPAFDLGRFFAEKALWSCR